MKRLLLAYILIMAVAFGLGDTVRADTTGTVTITAQGNVSGMCLPPTSLIATEVSDYEITLTWTPGGNVTATIIRGAFGRAVTSFSDGFSVYYGNGTSATYWVNLQFIDTDIYFAAYSLCGNGTYIGPATDEIRGGEGVTNMASIFVFIAPAIIAYLGIRNHRRLYPLTVAAGVLWLALSMWFIAQSAGPADLFNILGWVSIALGVAFAISPLWLGHAVTGKVEIEEGEGGIKEEEEEESYGDTLEKWEKRRGLRTRRSKYARE